MVILTDLEKKTVEVLAVIHDKNPWQARNTRKLHQPDKS